MAAAVESSNDAHCDESKDIIKQVRIFVKGSTHESNVSGSQLMQSALFLLRALPPAQDAVLEHLSNVFHELTHIYLRNLEDGVQPPNDEAGQEMIQDAVGVLLSLVKTSPKTWAPLITSWAFDLLGCICSKYSERRVVPRVSNLTEVLQLWMTCRATQALVEITSESFSSMVDCSVNALLAASASYSPHFDWVVAHIGSCFPKAIINQVFLTGLKDFYHHSNRAGPSGAPPTQPNLSSVVGILGHLGWKHSSDIQHALMVIFKRSLSAGVSSEEQWTLPYILHLSSLSPLLLSVITKHAPTALTPDVLNTISDQFSGDTALHRQDKHSLLQLVVHLLTSADEGGINILLFLLDTVAPSNAKNASAETEVKPAVKTACEQILDHVLLEVQSVVHSRCSDSSVEVPLLRSLVPHSSLLSSLLTEAHDKRLYWLVRLVTLLSLHSHDSVSTKNLSHIIQRATTPQQLWSVVEVQREVELRRPGVLEVSLGQIMSGDLDLQLINNLLHLTQWEQQDKTNSRCLVSSKLWRHLDALCAGLYNQDMSAGLVTMQLINNVQLPGEITIATLTKLCSATTMFFFSAFKSDLCQRAENLDLCISYMLKLCSREPCQKIILKHLLEGAISKKHGFLFGCKSGSDKLPKSTESLLAANQNNSSIKGGSIVHTGVIGSGLRTSDTEAAVPLEHKNFNKQKLIYALSTCAGYHSNTNDANAMETDSSGDVPGMSAEIAKFLALQLIELTTPDVMYNGIAWPEEDFMKVTVERDLQIKTMFYDCPVLWDLLDFLSDGAGALCYCSVLLRGLLATIIPYYESCRLSSPVASPWHLNAACRIIDYMRKGGMLPAPLHHTSQLLPHVSSYNAFLLLLNLWTYVKENPPVPVSRLQVEINCPPKYTDVIRFMLHSHIEDLGQFYPLFFSPSLN